MSNENNYPGATVSVVGYAAGEARVPAYDKNDSSGMLEISIPVNEGYKKDGAFVQTGTTWYTYSAHGEYADKLKAIHKGDKVRVDEAKQEVRTYKDREGVEKLGIGLRFGTIIVLESKSGSAVEEPF